MSLLIKGMEMPTSCWECPFERCVLRALVDRHPDCPLVHVPPHGPLIDASAKIEVQMFDEMYEEWTLKTMSVADYLAFAADMPPTIIEAEGGE